MLCDGGGGLACAKRQQGRPAVVVCQVGSNQVWISYGSLEKDCCQGCHVSGLATVRLQAMGEVTT